MRKTEEGDWSAGREASCWIGDPQWLAALTEDAVRSALDRLSARGLVRPFRGWAADASSGERVETYWWDLTDEGRALAESGPSAGL
jgi:hypothetical protein